MAEDTVEFLMPWEADTVRRRVPALINQHETLSVDVVSVTRLSSTQLRINFSVPVVDNGMLRATGSYEIRDVAATAPNLAVLSVTPQAITNPTYVTLTTEEQRSGVTYEVEVFTLEPA